MVRCSISYDKDIKERVFMIRGDERYTRSTNTIIEARECTVSADGFVQEIFVNVLRDVEDSSLVVYDNDVAVFTLNDWTSTDTGRVIQIPMLSYDTDHNIKVKYIGNSRCSPSMSNIITINQPNTYRINANLEFDTVVRNIADSNKEYTKTVTLTNENDAPLLNQDQLIDIYFDGDLIDTVETDSEGNAEFSYNSGAEGLHELYARFNGTPELYPTTSVTLKISSGFWFELTDAPAVQVYEETYDFKGRVHNFFETHNRANRIDVTLISVPDNIELDTQTSDMNGKVTFSGINTNTNQFKFKLSRPSKDYYSEVYTAPYYVPQSVSLQSSSDRLYKGETTTFTMQIDRPLANVPVQLQRVKEIFEEGEEEGVDEPSVSYEVISSNQSYTNENGIATISEINEGKLYNKYRAKVGSNVYSTVHSYAGYITYWSKINELLKKGTLNIRGGTLLELQDVFRMDSTNSYRVVRVDFPVPDNATYPWNVIIEGITTPSNSFLSIGMYEIMTERGLGTTEPLILPSRKYTNAQLLLAGRTDTNGLVYRVTENNTLIYNGEIANGYFHPSFSFRNHIANTQQFSFRRARYYLLEE